jgi:hypothetical protein
MYGANSEASILRGLLKEEIQVHSYNKEKLENLFKELNVECDIHQTRNWVDELHCCLHRVHFRGRLATLCPVGEFAQKLKKAYE